MLNTEFQYKKALPIKKLAQRKFPIHIKILSDNEIPTLYFASGCQSAQHWEMLRKGTEDEINTITKK